MQTLRVARRLWGLALEEATHAPELLVTLFAALVLTELFQRIEMIKEGRLKGFCRLEGCPVVAAGGFREHLINDA